MIDIPSTVTIATRQSPLARWQTQYVMDGLSNYYPQCEIRVMPMMTEADFFQEKALYEMEGKGAFVSSLEQALLGGQADIAVHSMKDVPMLLPDALCLSVICPREDPRDVWISAQGIRWDELVQNACIGTSSLRRQSQLLAMNPCFDIKPIRGNIGTRIEKVMRGEYDGVVLAAAGLKRLGWEKKITSIFSTDMLLPAAGQGAIGIECRAGDIAVQSMIACMHDARTALCVDAERRVNRLLDGGCHLPLAVHASCMNQQLLLQACIGTIDGTQCIAAKQEASVAQVDWLVEQVVEELRSQGGEQILFSSKHG